MDVVVPHGVLSYVIYDSTMQGLMSIFQQGQWQAPFVPKVHWSSILRPTNMTHALERKRLKYVRRGHAILLLPALEFRTVDWAVAALEGYIYHLKQREIDVSSLFTQYELDYQCHVPWYAPRFNLLLEQKDLKQAQLQLQSYEGYPTRGMFNQYTFHCLFDNREWSPEAWSLCQELIQYGAYKQAYNTDKDSYYIDDIVSWVVSYAPSDVILSVLQQEPQFYNVKSTFRMDRVTDSRNKHRFTVQEIVKIWAAYLKQVGVRDATEVFFSNFHGVSYLTVEQNEELMDWVLEQCHKTYMHVKISVEYHLGSDSWIIHWARKRGVFLLMPKLPEGIILKDTTVASLHARLDQMYNLGLEDYVNKDMTMQRFIEDRVWFMLDAFMSYEYDGKQPFKDISFNHSHLLAFVGRQSSDRYRDLLPEPYYSEQDRAQVNTEATVQAQLELQGKMWSKSPRRALQKIREAKQQELYRQWRREKQDQWRAERKDPLPLLHHYDPDESLPHKILRIQQALAQDWERFKFVLSRLASVDELNHKAMGRVLCNSSYGEIHPQVYRFLEKVEKRVKRFRDYQEQVQAAERERQAKVLAEQKKEKEAIEKHIIKLLLQCNKKRDSPNVKVSSYVGTAAYLVLSSYHDLHSEDDMRKWIQQQLKSTGRSLDDLGAAIHFSPEIPADKKQQTKEEKDEKKDARSVADFVTWTEYFEATKNVKFADYKGNYGHYYDEEYDDTFSDCDSDYGDYDDYGYEDDQYPAKLTKPPQPLFNVVPDPDELICQVDECEDEEQDCAYEY